jgi:protein-tyrosine phosphatase
MAILKKVNGKLVLYGDQLSHLIENVWAGEQPTLVTADKIPVSISDPAQIVLPESLEKRLYYVYEINHRKYITAERNIHLDGTFNLRDLGGYVSEDGRTVIWGRFLRSDALGKISDSGVKYLDAMHLHTVIDFRNLKERTKVPDCLDVKWQYQYLDPQADTAALASAAPKDDQEKISHLLDIASTVQGRSVLEAKKNEMIGQYQEFVSGSESKRVYAKFVHICMQTNALPILFHCRGGKDRTGFAALLILSMLGVDRDTINEDYMLTAENMQRRNESRMNDYKKYTDNSYVLEYLHCLMMTKSEYIDAAWNELECYGGIQRYLNNELNVDDAMLKHFKNDNLDE